MYVSVDQLVVEIAPQLRAALVAAYGVDAGSDAASEAMAWALEHRERVAGMENPAGYLYRVGQTAARRARRPTSLLPTQPTQTMPDVEPGLVPALDALSTQQRVVVVMVHALGWSQAAVGELLEVSPSTIAAHLQRGMASLRESMGVTVNGG